MILKYSSITKEITNVNKALIYYTNLKSCTIDSSNKMRGGTKSSVKVNGSCLRPSKNTQGVRHSRPSISQATIAQDTKVTVISQDEMDTLKSNTSTPLVKQKQTYQEALSGGEWGPPLGMPHWNTTSETFTQTKRNNEQKPLHQETSPPPPAMEDEVKVLCVADSIGSHCDFQSIEEATKVDIVTKRAYSSVEDMRAKWPESNFRDVVEVQLAKGNYNHLVMQAPSVDITNLKSVKNKTSKQYQRGEASTSSFNTIKTAERALQKYPNLKGVLITERAPRHDNMRELSQFSNEELHRHLKHSIYKNQIKIGIHTLDFEGEERDSVYGSKKTNTIPDGYHLRGPNGKLSFTKSLLNIFHKAGLNRKQKTQVQQVVKKVPITLGLFINVNSVKQVPQCRPTLVKVRSPTTLEIPAPMVQNKPKNVIKERKKNAVKVSKQKVQKSNDIVLSNKFAPLVNYQPVENPQSMPDCKVKYTKSQYKKNKNDKKPKKITNKKL